jgi:hypothetical protein
MTPSLLPCRLQNQIHRHHKRTPYAANTFPHETQPWSCSDTSLYHYAAPLGAKPNHPAQTYWTQTTSPSNPFTPAGFPGSCEFPQITHDGLQDSYEHGQDLWGVYHDLLRFIPTEPDSSVVFRVTNNEITSQVAGMIVAAFYPGLKEGGFPLQIQPPSVDSLEPTYPCPSAVNLYANYGVTSTNPLWTTHLTASAPLFTALDAISGVAPSDPGFHQSWDHYYDHLSSLQCHSKPLPCSLKNDTLCVTQEQADEVYRLGQYEYSYIYRGSSFSLQAAVASYGVYIAELAQNIRCAISGKCGIKYKHNVAHDGSISRLLAILQVDVMVWPGMGSEVVFEVYRSAGGEFVRVLWGGKVLRSSDPSLGVLDMVQLDVLLGYFDGLVGVDAKKIVGLCATS